MILPLIKIDANSEINQQYTEILNFNYHGEKRELSAGDMSAMLMFQFGTSKRIGIRQTLQNWGCNQRFTMKHELKAYILVRKAGLFRFR